MTHDGMGWMMGGMAVFWLLVLLFLILGVAAFPVLAAAGAAETGYRLSADREVTIPGLCPDCQHAAAPADHHERGHGHAHP